MHLLSSMAQVWIRIHLTSSPLSLTISVMKLQRRGQVLVQLRLIYEFRRMNLPSEIDAHFTCCKHGTPLNTQILKSDALSNMSTEEEWEPFRGVRGYYCYEKGGSSCQAGYGNKVILLPMSQRGEDVAGPHLICTVLSVLSTVWFYNLLWDQPGWACWNTTHL